MSKGKMKCATGVKKMTIGKYKKGVSDVNLAGNSKSTILPKKTPVDVAAARAEEMNRKAQAKIDAASNATPNQYPGEAELARRQKNRIARENSTGEDIVAAKPTISKAKVVKPAVSDSAYVAKAARVVGAPISYAKPKVSTISSAESSYRQSSPLEKVEPREISIPKTDGLGAEAPMELKKLEVAAPKKKGFIGRAIDRQRQKEAINHAELEHEDALEEEDALEPKQTKQEGSKPMNFISRAIHNQREKEKANHKGLEYEEEFGEDATSATTPTEGKKKNSYLFQGAIERHRAKKAAQESNVAPTQETSFVGPRSARLEGEDARNQLENKQKTEKIRVEAENARDAYEKGVPSSSKWNDPAEMARVKAYQQRHGLKADGIWGDKTKAYYKASLNKPSATVSKGTGSKGTGKAVVKKTTTTPSAQHLATGWNDGKGNVYFSNGRMRTKEGKMQNYDKSKVFKSAPEGEGILATAGRLGKEYGDKVIIKSGDSKKGQVEIDRAHNFLNKTSKTLGMGEVKKNKSREGFGWDDVTEIGVRDIPNALLGSAGYVLGGNAGATAAVAAADPALKKLSSTLTEAGGYEKPKDNGDYTVKDAAMVAAGGAAGKLLQRAAPLVKGAAKKMILPNSPVGRYLEKRGVATGANAAASATTQAATNATANSTAKTTSKSILTKAKDKAKAAYNYVKGETPVPKSTKVMGKPQRTAAEEIATKEAWNNRAVSNVAKNARETVKNGNKANFTYQSKGKITDVPRHSSIQPDYNVSKATEQIRPREVVPQKTMTFKSTKTQAPANSGAAAQPAAQPASSSTTTKAVAQTTGKAKIAREEPLRNGYVRVHFENGGTGMKGPNGKMLSKFEDSKYTKQFETLTKKEAEAAKQAAANAAPNGGSQAPAQSSARAARTGGKKGSKTTATTTKFANAKMPPGPKGGANTNTAAFKKK